MLIWSRNLTKAKSRLDPLAPYGELKSFDDLEIHYEIDTMGNNTVLFTLTDGDPEEDEDGLKNAVVVDPVVIGQAVVMLT